MKIYCTYPNLFFVWIVTLLYLEVQATQMVTFGSVDQRGAVMYLRYGHHLWNFEIHIHFLHVALRN